MLQLAIFCPTSQVTGAKHDTAVAQKRVGRIALMGQRLIANITGGDAITTCPHLANFANGELWGRASDMPWAMVFPAAGPDPRHPSQLYQAAMEGIVLFLVLRFVTHRLKGLRHPGLVTGVFIAGYGCARIIGEQFRQPDAGIGFLWGGLTMGMLLSLPMVLAGLGLAFWAKSRPAVDMSGAND